jgi:acetyl esterase/lipase
MAASITITPYVAFGEADGMPLLLDIAQPDAPPVRPLPVIMYIHGGAWLAGDRRTTRNNLFAAHGFFTVSVEYRLSQQALFPAQLHDVKAAVRWLRANADQLHIDPQRIGVWGHSAGAHLAALLGTTGDVAELEGTSGSPGYSSRVQAVATLAAPTDFLQMGGTHDDPDSPEARLVGGPIHERMAEVARANPITYVSRAMPPFLLLHGAADDTVPAGQSRLLFDALRAAGADVTLHMFPGAGHGFDDADPAWHNAQHQMLAFFQTHLVK